MKSHMVAVDTMEQFQKELDQGKVRISFRTVCYLVYAKAMVKTV